MNELLSALVAPLDNGVLARTNVIRWGAPVPSFGDPEAASVATLGLNPSNREFVDEHGEELHGPARRFHTLTSLGLERWSEAHRQHIALIADSCRSYFTRNPYDRWFRKLDAVIAGTGASYYSDSPSACHLDLIPYATACKWTELPQSERSHLVEVAQDTLAHLLRDSSVRVLVLNGRSVVRNFEQMSARRLERRRVQSWGLPRQSRDVAGISYRGRVSRLGGVELEREILVLGYNHNIQSSFGVTNKVTESIRRWITRHAGKVLA